MNQYYDPEILGKEYVMRGNAAILKCTIPSFVADFVQVVAWIDEDNREYVPTKAANFSGGKSFVGKLLKNPKRIHIWNLLIYDFEYFLNFAQQLWISFTMPK